MFETPFYNKHIRNLVSVFGTLFNDIQIQKRDAAGNILETNRVPLAYGPKQKFIARLEEEKNPREEGIAIKLPRMAFEITSIDYDATAKLNKNIKDAYAHPTDSYKKRFLRTFAPYNIGFQLSILAKNMDEGLQIIEQILPLFQPDYTVTIIENSNVNRKTDVPFTLQAVNLTEEYEGDFLYRRTIVYTLDFTSKLRFYQGIQDSGIIKHTEIGITDTTVTPQILLEKIKSDVDPATASPEDEYEIIDTIDYFVEH
jgi:hypothetical protein